VPEAQLDELLAAVTFMSPRAELVEMD